MLSEQIRSIKEKISGYLKQAGRPADSVRLVAVSKTFSAEKIQEAYEHGLRDFGENYTDELIKKHQQLSHLRDIRWVFIGQLQSNKIQKIVRVADEIQSIASEKHARYIERYAGECGKNNFPVWINVNAGDEDTKQGLQLNQALELAKFITERCSHLSLQGLMAIPPAFYNDAQWATSSATPIPDLYVTLRRLASNVGQGKLSLGMSNDLAIAILAGTDCVRIGSAIFGSRS